MYNEEEYARIMNAKPSDLTVAELVQGITWAQNKFLEATQAQAERDVLARELTSRGIKTIPGYRIVLTPRYTIPEDFDPAGLERIVEIQLSIKSLEETSGLRDIRAALKSREDERKKAYRATGSPDRIDITLREVL